MLSNSGVLHPYKFNENWNKHESWSTTEWIMMSFSKEQFLTFRKSQCLVWSLVFVSMVTSQSLHKHRNITAGVEGLVFSCIGQRSISKTVSMSSQTELHFIITWLRRALAVAFMIEVILRGVTIVVFHFLHQKTTQVFIVRASLSWVGGAGVVFIGWV